MDFSEMRSGIDRSVNFIADHGAGVLEARYVRRTEDYFIRYHERPPVSTVGRDSDASQSEAPLAFPHEAS